MELVRSFFLGLILLVAALAVADAKATLKKGADGAGEQLPSEMQAYREKREPHHDPAYEHHPEPEYYPPHEPEYEPYPRRHDNHGRQECLYVGDGGSDPNNVKWWSADGSYKGAFVQGATTGVSMLTAPRGLQWGQETGKLYVANANAGQTCLTGSVLRYNGKTGAFEKAVVQPQFAPFDDPETCENKNITAVTNLLDVNSWAPFQPNDILVDEMRGLLYVADFAGTPDIPGRLAAYKLDADSGCASWLFDFKIDTALFPHPFHPRGLAKRSWHDPFLYVTARVFDDPKKGWVLRFNVHTRQLEDVFVDSATCNCPLQRPDGLAFDAEGVLHVMTFNSTEQRIPDGISAFGSNGQYLPDQRINLWDPVIQGQAGRVYAQKLAFDDHNNLYTALTFGPDDLVGDIRKYRPPFNSARFEVFAQGDPTGATGAVSPWNLIWGPCH